MSFSSDNTAPAKDKTHAITRGLCLFFGAFALVNAIVCVKGGTTAQNMNMWWIDLSSLAVSYEGSNLHFGFAIETAAAVAMIAWCLKPRCCAIRRAVTCVLTFCLAVFAALNAVTYFKTLAAGTLYHALPIPLSCIIAIIFVLITISVAKSHPKKHTGIIQGTRVIAVAVIAALLFPLLQITFFGTTDYRRQADAAVVFGARVYEDGNLSVALRERMDTAIELYNQKLVTIIIVTGGIEDGNVDEAQAMYNYALQNGVPASALLIDRYGDNTVKSVKNTISLAKRYQLKKVIATSSFYHMPRIKMLYNLENFDVYTVPTVGDVIGNGTLASIWREIPAWWWYWLKGMAQ